jgi:glycosyltransferase involved in cell wall biosynthesis
VRILIVSNLYPPAAVGGYEVECSGVAERLAENHEVIVLTSAMPGAAMPSANVRRELTFLSVDERGALRAPGAAISAVRAARAALAWNPDLVYAWNCAAIPQAAVRVIADSGTPLAFRVCEHWFARLFLSDQFLRELLPARRSAARSAWSLGCRALNRLPALRLDPTAPLRTAVSWNSDTMRRMAHPPPFADVVAGGVCHSVPRYGDLYAAADRHPVAEPTIVFVGRVTAVKGVDVAIEALALLDREHGIRACLDVAGPDDGDYGRQMRQLAERLGVADRVRWRGPMPPPELAELVAGASAMIVPSTWDEPFPLVTIEGALARVPLVASNVGGIPEGMRPEEHALFFERGDAHGAAAALTRTLREVQQTAARVERARVRAEQFRIGPYLEAQERFVIEAHAALTASRPQST